MPFGGSQLCINQSTAAASESWGVTDGVLEETRPSALLPSRRLGCSCSPACLSACVLQSWVQTQPLATCAGLWHEQAAGWGSGLGSLQLFHRVLGLGFRLAPEKGEILALIPLSPAASSSEVCDYLTCHSLLRAHSRLRASQEIFPDPCKLLRQGALSRHICEEGVSRQQGASFNVGLLGVPLWVVPLASD